MREGDFMSDLLTAVVLKKDASFSFQDEKRHKTTIEINQPQFRNLLKKLGPNGLMAHLILLSFWDDPKGLPSLDELADYLCLTAHDTTYCINQLLTTKIDGVLLYDKNELSYRNPNKHDIYN